jgi:uncharacterized membrane protein YgcG
MSMTRKQRRYLNIGMVVLAALIVAAGVVYVLYMRGAVSVQPAQAATLSVSDKTGSVSVERAGLSHVLDKGSTLQDGDKIETQEGASATIDLSGAGSFTLSENATVVVHVSDAVSLEVTDGDVYIDSTLAGLSVTMPVGSVSSDDMVCAVSVPGQENAQVQVLHGNVTCPGDTSASEKTTADLYTGDKVETGALAAKDLSDFAIEQALDSLANGRELCFAKARLAKVQDERAQAKKASGSAAKAKTENAEKAEDAKDSEDETSSASSSESSQSSGKSTSSSSQSKSGKSSGSKSSSKSTGKTTKKKYVTIEIRCDTILDNLDALADGKEKYVASDGTILAKTKVQIATGDTVFDVLKAVCKKYDIALEYASSATYSGTFVDSINHLASGDCGDTSGWIYKVNGYTPNYACDKYKLKNNDSILWGYTCKDYGADVE